MNFTAFTDFVSEIIFVNYKCFVRHSLAMRSKSVFVVALAGFYRIVRDFSSASGTTYIHLEPASNALFVVVMFDVAGHDGYCISGGVGTHANDTVV